MNRKGKKIYVQERLTAKVLQRCKVIRSCDGSSQLYYDPVRRRIIKLRERPKMETEREYPPFVAKQISLVNTLAVWSNVKVRVQVTYNRETDEIISNIERLDK